MTNPKVEAISGMINFSCPECNEYITISVAYYKSTTEKCRCGYIWNLDYEIKAS